MLKPLLEAIRFLTVVPLPGLPATVSDDYERTIAHSVAWFPLVGLLIGSITCALGLLATFFWPGSAFVRAVLIVVVSSALTAGLHLDGLSDTADGTMSWRPRERMLEIMKDSRIGAMGAIALVAIFLLKVGFLAAAGQHWWMATLLAPMLGRWADIFGIFFYPAAREGGLGRSFNSMVRPHDFVIGTLFVIGAAVLISLVDGFLFESFLKAYARCMIALALVCLASVYLARKWVQQLGGLTGDTYGALNEVGETVALAAMSAVVA